MKLSNIMILDKHHYFIDFCNNMEIPLIVCTEEKEIIFKNKFFNILFTKEPFIKILEDTSILKEKHSYKETSDSRFKIRWDIALKVNDFLYITARIIEHIHKKMLTFI
ncbi:hypothetical protein CDH04_08155 [Francisella adeliensis]|uniref:Uncharacterized protein n=2 Tax=Francisella adeliensis TaxID=2007306 RepID=A0A2Z4Y080_9GAMM|nr:hypothetical protein CDH04_08155 [Francisella adeliensis]